MNKLIEFFSFNGDNSQEKWTSSLHKFSYSGFNLVDEINNLNPELVLDVGCGYNEFKGKIKNLIGIDISNNQADIVSDFLNYECENNSVDVILALGSINFINFNTVSMQVQWIYDKLKPGGLAYIRVNPSKPPGRLIEEDFYIWKDKDIWHFIDKHNFKLYNNAIITEFHKEDDRNSFRYFFILQK